jgi:Flp pilus assembly protein TadB
LDYQKIAAEHDARKKKIETLIRFSSGFLVLATWNLSYLMGTLYMQIVPFIFGVFVFVELSRLKRDQDKDKESKI